jgi:hypothetical protein
MPATIQTCGEEEKCLKPLKPTRVAILDIMIPQEEQMDWLQLSRLETERSHVSVSLACQ